MKQKRTFIVFSIYLHVYIRKERQTDRQNYHITYLKMY